MNYTPFANTLNEDMDSEAGFSSSLLTFAAIMTFMIMVVGIFGNFLTVAALVKCPKVRNVAAAFIISLCIADLLFCALVLPFSAFRFIQGTWTHGDVLCQLIPFIQYGNIGVSLLCIGMITVNRYVMIAHHSVYGKIYKRHWIAVMIAFCWLFSYGMQLPTLLGVWGKFGYDPKLATCSIMEDSNGRSSKTTLFITAFVIPCLIIIACYAKIFWVVHKSEQRLKKHANKQNSIPNNLRPPPPTTTGAAASSGDGGLNRISSNLASDSSCSYSTDVKHLDALQQQKSTSRVKDQREVRAKRNEWRITKMVLAIFLSFVVCYLPITIAKVADKDVEHPGFHIFSYIMLYLSACINPIIYVIMNKQYRKAYKTVIMCEPSKLLPYIGGKTPGGSSVGEMERYRIEQQPQPHNGIANVGRRTGGNGSNGPTGAKYQLKQLHQPPITANCAGDDNNINHGDDYDKPNHCENYDPLSLVPITTEQQKGDIGSKRWATATGNYPVQDTHEYYATSTSHDGAQRAQSHSFSGGRYYSGRRGRSPHPHGNTGDDYDDSGSRQPTSPTRQSNNGAARNPEESPILWTKHQRHSR